MWGKCAIRVALFVALQAAFWAGLSRDAQAKPVEYVKVCSLYGEGFYYIPGTDTCIKIGGSLPTFRDGTICTYVGGRPYFADRQGCPRSSVNLQSVVRCGASGPGVYADTRGICSGVRNFFSNPRTQTAYGTLRSYPNWGVDLGVSAGANVYSPNFGYLRGFDSLAAPAVRTDQRDINLGGTSAVLGVDFTAWRVMPVTPLTPDGTRGFIQASFLFPINSSNSETVTGVNVIPKGTVTTEYKSNYQIGLFAGVSYDLNRTIFGYPNWGYPNIGMMSDMRLRLGGGGLFNNRKISVFGTDTSGVNFESSRTSTDFEPGFLVGIKGNVGGGYMVGLDVINTFPCFISTTAQSGFPSQTYKGAVDGGVNTTVKLGLSKVLFSGN